MQQATHEDRIPMNNKLRLVYATNKHGAPISYRYVEHSTANKIFKVVRFLNRQKDWVTFQDLQKGLCMSRSSLYYIIERMVGAQWADMRRNHQFETVFPAPLLITKNTLYNPKANVSRKLRYLKPTCYYARPRQRK